MIRRLLGLKPRSPSSETSAGSEGVALPEIHDEVLRRAIDTVDGVPQVDCFFVDEWAHSTEPDPDRRRDLVRAVVAAWLDQLATVISAPMSRWRTGEVEGLAPAEHHNSVRRLQRWSGGSLATIRKAMEPIRGGGPLPPLGVVALPTLDSYYDVLSGFYPGEGDFPTSGGVYLNGDTDVVFPMLIINATQSWSLEVVLAHELTHHVLADCGLPAWVEEGLAQMMEQRVTGFNSFAVNHEDMMRHREFWSEVGLHSFVSGDAFHEAEGEFQERSYHLAQLVTRSLLETKVAAFFAFARACSTLPADDAAERHLGADLQTVIENLLYLKGQ